MPHDIIQSFSFLNIKFNIFNASWHYSNVFFFSTFNLTSWIPCDVIKSFFSFSPLTKKTSWLLVLVRICFEQHRSSDRSFGAIFQMFYQKSIFRKSAKTTSTSKLLRQSRRCRRRRLPTISFEFSTCENRNGGVTSTVRMWIVRTEFTFNESIKWLEMFYKSSKRLTRLFHTYHGAL